MPLPTPPNIQAGQIALDPVNGLVYYRDKDNNIVSTSWSWLKSNVDQTITTDDITINNDLIISGNLTVGGDTISLNVAQILVEDNFLILNSNATGSPTLNAGVEVERGTLTNVSIRWNETTDKWQFTNNGVDYNDLLVLTDLSGITTLSSLSTVGTITSGTWNGSLITGQRGGTGVANTGKTITVSGNTTIGSSTHTVTFTTSGNTSVGLPTSGTLVTTTATTLSSLNTVGTISSGTWNASVITGQFGGTGVANTGKTITVSGNTTIGSSTHTVEFVTTGNTSVTLPTSGTLVSTTTTSLSSLATVGIITSGTWSGSFGAVSGANLTNLTAANLTGTIPSTVLANSTLYIGTTALALNRASANLALTGISSLDTSSTSFNLINNTATTVNLAGGASTALNIGNSSGTNTISGTTVISGRLDVQQIREKVLASSISSNIMTCDYSTGTIFNQSATPSANFTANFTNVPTDNNYAITTTIMVTQGAVGYYPNTVVINGATPNIKWPNGTVPTPTSSSGKIDMFTFTLLRSNDGATPNWTVFGGSSLNY